MRVDTRNRIVTLICMMVAASVHNVVCAADDTVGLTPEEARIEMMRQLYEATNVYAFNAPVLVEETAVAVKLPDGVDHIRWDKPAKGFTPISLPGRPSAVIALDIKDQDALLSYLGDQGKVTVLHRRRWTVLNNHGSFVYQGASPAVTRATRSAATGKITTSGWSRSGSTKLTLNIRGIDLSGATRANPKPKVLDFDMTLEMNYARGEDNPSNPSRLASLTVESRTKLVSGQTLLIEDVNGDDSVLFMLTLTLVGD